MTKKYWIQVIVCFLIILIGSVLGVYYYQEYISPESFTIGSISNGTYKELAIKDYLSDDTVLFSQNINDVSFSINDDTATYDYNFDAKEFNGLEKDYLIYVNNYIINDITTNAGTISGTYKINFQDVDNETLCSSDISISFTFRSLSSVLRVSLPASDIGYLLNYFKSDNFIITLAESPFDFGNKDGEVDEKVQQIIDLTNQIAGLNEDIVELQGAIADKVQEIADLNEDLANKDEIIAGLQSDIEELQAQVQQLQGNLSEKTQQLEDLQAEYDQLEDDYGELDDEYIALGNLYDQALATIESLEAQVLELEQQVAYYEQLLEAYQNVNKFTVVFEVDSVTYDIQLLDSGDSPILPITPVKDGYTFEGWMLDGDLVDPSTIEITSDTTFSALFEVELFDMQITLRDGTIETLQVTQDLTADQIVVDNVSELAVMNVPEGVKEIGDAVFPSVPSLYQIILPSTLEKISPQALGNAEKLVEIVNKSNLDLNIEDISTSTELHKILEIVPESELINSNGNIYKIFNDEKYFITNINNATEIVIDSGTKYVITYACTNLKQITNVNIPESITGIEMAAFLNTSIESVYIPTSVSTLESGAFRDVDIYTGYDSRPSNDWNSSLIRNNIMHWGYTYEQYLAEVQI